jgi:hypothetical protein
LPIFRKREREFRRNRGRMNEEQMKVVDQTA